VIIGSGAGGASAAWELALAGFEVTVLEKGRNYFRGLGDSDGLRFPVMGGDEIRKYRGFPGMDTLAEPRTRRSQDDATDGVERVFTGDVNHLPSTVGGGTTHWDAKTPRFWKMDFEMKSRFGDVPGASMADWPFGYDDLASWYEVAERRLGVQGDLSDQPGFALAEAPRGEFPMPAGPPMYSGLLFQKAAASLGYEVCSFPMAANTRIYDDRPTCSNCGYCSGFGCPINARGGAAVSFLHPAIQAGAKLVTRALVTKIATGHDGRATHVEYLSGDERRPTRLEADLVILAASAVESARLALRSTSTAHPNGLGNASDLVGRYLCFHTSTFATAVMPQRLHPHRGRSCSHVMYEPCRPVTAERWLRWLDLPFLRGGVCEIGGSSNLLDEAMIYFQVPFLWRSAHKDHMRESRMRDRMLGVQMLGEDLPQFGNRVDLDPEVKDIYGLPVARITYDLHLHEKVASWYWALELREILRASGADSVYFLPAGLSPIDSAQANHTRHMSGTLRMGTEPETSVTDAYGRIHGAPNVVVCDSSVFPTSGAFNPTLTICAVSMRNATAVAYGDEAASAGPVAGGRSRTPATLPSLADTMI
jgi:choline dehydrogenase-like flavoprotein